MTDKDEAPELTDDFFANAILSQPGDNLIDKMAFNLDAFATLTDVVGCHVEEHGKEFWLVWHGTPKVDCWIEFRGEKVNLPFRPHVLVAKYDLKTMDIPYLIRLAQRMKNNV